MKIINYLGRVGRALMLPIATLPAAALFLRLGADDLLGSIKGFETFAQIISQLGNVMFANLALIFALGIAIGLAEDNHGAAAIAALIMFFCIKDVSKYWVPIFNSSVTKVVEVKMNSGFLGGVVAGIFGGEIYNKFKNIQLPKALAFFSGRRFVPLMTLVFGLFVSLAFGLLWPGIENGIGRLGLFIASQSKPVAAGTFTIANRLLIPFGLHHILNSLFWFTLNGGDLNNFFATPQVVGSGVYMTGFFPTMMFALPAIVAAMVVAADKDKRKATAYLLGGAALVGFLTGVTEPVEFAFLFVAPALYLLYAIMSGIIAAITIATGALTGFGFSAGLFDLVLNWGISTKPWMIVIIGLVSMPIYFVIFYTIIKKFNISTPGRGKEGKKILSTVKSKAKKENNSIAADIIKALGGKANIKKIDNCSTRLRLSVKDSGKINEDALKSAGAIGVMRLSKTTAQVIIGTHVQQIADSMKELV